MLEFSWLLISLLSFWLIELFFFSALEVEANENVRDNGLVEDLTSGRSTEMNILKDVSTPQYLLR